MESNEAKRVAADAIEAREPDLLALSHAVHGFAETAYAEHRSAAACVATLRAAGVSAETGAYGLETAFVADFGRGERRVALCCEYDALPGLGHACAHNVIAAAGVGAALGLAAVADDLGLAVRVLGTPAEETGGGKIALLQTGAFDDVDAALMVHAFPHDASRFASLAVAEITATFTGRAAHAATAPHEAINAGDAATVAQVAIGLLRQQLPEGVWVHGVVREAGQAQNIIPDRAVLSYGVRAAELPGVEAAVARLEDCFRGAAVATGCRLDLARPSATYQEFLLHEGLAAAYQRNAGARGRSGFRPAAAVASTDMGNVSHRVPSLHALIDIGAGGVTPHQAPFADAARGEGADRAVLDAAVALAWTAIDVALDDGAVLTPAPPAPPA